MSLQFFRQRPDHGEVPTSHPQPKRKLIITKNGKVIFAHDKKDSWKIYTLGAVLLVVFVYTQVKFLN